MNNQVWYYRIEHGQPTLVSNREYLGTVDYVRLGAEHAAVLTGGRITLQLIDMESAGGSAASAAQKIFPEKENESDITCMAMTSDFLIYSTSRGAIHFFSLEDWTFVNEFRFKLGIRKIFPNPLGTRIVLIDDTNAGYLYSPVNDQTVPIERLSGSTEKVMWDQNDWGVFVAVDPRCFTTYVYSPNSRRGARVEAVKQQLQLNSDQVCWTDRPSGFVPILAYGGIVTCQTATGSLAQVSLETHSCLGQIRKDSRDLLVRAFYQNLHLLRLKEAYESAALVNGLNCWNDLAATAIDVLDIEMAIRVCESQNSFFFAFFRLCARAIWA